MKMWSEIRIPRKLFLACQESEREGRCPVAKAFEKEEEVSSLPEPCQTHLEEGKCMCAALLWLEAELDFDEIMFMPNPPQIYMGPVGDDIVISPQRPEGCTAPIKHVELSIYAEDEEPSENAREGKKAGKPSIAYEDRETPPAEA